MSWGNMEEDKKPYGELAVNHFCVSLTKQN